VSTRRLFLKGLLVGGAGLLATGPSLLAHVPADVDAGSLMTLRLLTGDGVFEYPKVATLDSDNVLRCADLVFDGLERAIWIDGLQAAVTVFGKEHTVQFNMAPHVPLLLHRGNSLTLRGISVRLM
jgi:hypothetical protein